MNKVILIGNVVRDPDIRVTTTGKNFARFSLAVTRNFKNADGKKEADYVACVAWGKTAEIVDRHCRKGTKIGVFGRLESGSYEKNGTKIYTTDLVVEEITFCGRNLTAEEEIPF